MTETMIEAELDRRAGIFAHPPQENELTVLKAALARIAELEAHGERKHHEAIDVLNRAMHAMAANAERLAKERNEARARIAELLQLISDRDGAQPCGTLETSTVGSSSLA